MTMMTDTGPAQVAVSIDDFLAYMPAHSYIFRPTRDMWPAGSVNARCPPVPIVDASGITKVDDKGKPVTVAAASWLDKHRAVEQMTWAPGEPPIIEHKLVSNGGWVHRADAKVFNLYRAPSLALGNSDLAAPWFAHVKRLYGSEAGHILRWLAHRVQKPHEKINHALVLGGSQGIGKDTLLEPVKRAIGPWNFQEVSPRNLLGRFNPFAKAVILRVNEARDLGDVDRYQFYDHMKVYEASPPDVIMVDEKHTREYAVFNVCGVVITSNHKGDGIYLPPDDRRHFVAWSDVTKEDFTANYFTDLYAWLDEGGDSHVAAYLQLLDLSDFDAKAPPPKTDAFWDIVDANRSPEDAEIADAIDRLDNPLAVTIDMIATNADAQFAIWLREQRNRRIIPHRLDSVGYVPVRNQNAQDGLWKIAGKRQTVYALRELSTREKIAAATTLSKRNQ